MGPAQGGITTTRSATAATSNATRATAARSVARPTATTLRTRSWSSAIFAAGWLGNRIVGLGGGGPLS